mgnify:CR=1 FL=1
MNKLNDVQLKAIAPPSITRDKQVQALCDAIDVALREIAAAAELILLLPRLDTLPEEIVDELAWQYHVDFYDYSADLAIKRSLIRQAIVWHRRKGTPAAVEEVCAAVFKTAKVFENWEYGGEPYHFQVRLIEEGIPDETVIANLHRAIAETKNTRSWLDGLSFYREVYGSLIFGACVSQHKTVEIYPAKFKAYDISGKQFIGFGKHYHRKVELI